MNFKEEELKTLWTEDKKNVYKDRIELNKLYASYMECYRLSSDHIFNSPLLTEHWQSDGIISIGKKRVEKPGVVIESSRGFLTPIGEQRRGLFDKRYLYQIYTSVHPVTTDIANRLLSNTDHCDLEDIDLSELLGEEGNKMLSVLPKKTSEDIKRIKTLVELYAKDYNAFLKLLPHIKRSNIHTYPIKDLERLESLNNKCGLIHNEGSIMIRRKVARSNENMLQLSYRILDN